MPLEKLVIFFMKSKKIVLFIVEGITDRNSFALILSKIIERNKIVRFKVINGDVTTQNGVNASNIYTKITHYIKEFITSDMYKKSDIFSVIHLEIGRASCRERVS